jgi:hypothetical protein
VDEASPVTSTGEHGMGHSDGDAHLLYPKLRPVDSAKQSLDGDRMHWRASDRLIDALLQMI